MVEQLRTLIDADTKTRSIRELEVDDKRVGSVTTWVRHKLEAIVCWSLEDKGLRELQTLTLKSPNRIKLDKSDTSTYRQIELSKVSKIETGASGGR